MARYAFYILRLTFITPLKNNNSTPHRATVDNHTYAAITAVVVANIVLVAYILSSILEDQNDQARIEASKESFESRKNR
jgi:hypothetical protein